MEPVTAMHAKSDSEVTCQEALSPPRSPPRRAATLYYVQSPSQHDAEKMSYGSSPLGTPVHHHPYHYRCSPPTHHSRESSTSRYSATLKTPGRQSGDGGAAPAQWKRLLPRPYFSSDGADDDSDGEDSGEAGPTAKFYVPCFVLCFVVLFAAFSLILWAASLPYGPKISVKSIVFESINLQAGMDGTGVPTDLLTLNSTVRISYSNPAAFFGVHVTSTPLELHYYQLKVASGQMTKFYQSRKSRRSVAVMVKANQVALYGGLSLLGTGIDDQNMMVPLNLTFLMRTRGFVFGRLVKPKFYTSVRCAVTLRGNQLGRPHNLTGSCAYN